MLKKQPGGKVAAAAAVAGVAAGILAVDTAAEGCCCHWEPHLQCVGCEMQSANRPQVWLVCTDSRSCMRSVRKDYTGAPLLSMTVNGMPEK